ILSQELFSQLRVVVDFAVERDPVSARRIAHRLLARIEIDDAQTVVPEMAAWHPARCVTIRSAMLERCHHAVDGITDTIKISPRDQTNAAHALADLHCR